MLNIRSKHALGNSTDGSFGRKGGSTKVDVDQSWHFSQPLGMLSRQQCLTRINRNCIRQKNDPNDSFSLFLVKIDRLRILRYSLGDETIDKLLIDFSKRLQENLAPWMVAAHLREDEFVVLLEHNYTNQDILEYAERLNRELKFPFNISGIEIFLGIHIGITNSRISALQPIHLINDAGLAA
ncbi:MAG: GGDEF domain-containing protein [Thermosynechococcaceae cyanobacterium]